MTVIQCTRTFIRTYITICKDIPADEDGDGRGENAPYQRKQTKKECCCHRSIAKTTTDAVAVPIGRTRKTIASIIERRMADMQVRMSPSAGISFERKSKYAPGTTIPETLLFTGCLSKHQPNDGDSFIRHAISIFLIFLYYLLLLPIPCSSCAKHPTYMFGDSTTITA